jgi:DNA-binding MarR family transcriptional regulator
VLRDLSFQLHILTARLDRAADRILHTEEALSYSRFLALFAIGELGAGTQRLLAEHLGVSEPSVSRMTSILIEAGLVVASHRIPGNRHQLGLTAAGKKLVRRCCTLLEDRLAKLVAASGVPYAQYHAHTRRLVAALDGDDGKRRTARARKEAP